MYIRHLLIALFMVFSAPALLSESQPIQLKNFPIGIEKKIELLAEKENLLDIETVQSMSFMEYNEWKTQLQPNEVYWGKFSITNNFDNGPSDINWVVDFPIVLTDIQLYKKERNGEFSERRTGQFVPIKERSVKAVFKTNYIQLYVYPGETTEVFFKAKTDRKWATPEFDIEIMTARNFVKNLKNSRFGQGLFIGFMMMMLVYNLFLYFITAKDNAYINYSVYILGIVLYSAYNSGDLADMTNSFWLPHLPKYSYLGKASTYLVIYGYLHFLKSFLNLNDLLPKWGKALQVLLWINAISFFADVLSMFYTNFNYSISDWFTVGNAILFVVYIFSICFVLHKTNHKSRYFIIGGILLMGIGSVITIIARINGVEYSTLPFQVGTILEVIIFSLGLVSRRRFIEREKQKAEFELEKSRLLVDQEKKETERAKQLEQLKSDLYANITHEFRTPIQIINGNLDFIEDHNKEKEVIKRSSEKMLRLVDQILDLSKLEAQLLEVNYKSGDLVEFFNVTIGSFVSLAHTQGITLNLSTDEEQMIMDFDQEKLEHIIYNLISNALKFTSEGGAISVKLSRIINGIPNQALIQFSDTGSGISEEHLPYIFDRFYKSNSDENAGWGIGLAYTYELIKLMNGSIKVDSQIDKGSTFYVQLPIKSESPNEAISLSDTKIQREFIHEDLNELNQNGDQDLSMVLVIEDNRDIVSYICRVLKDHYTVHVAYDGEEGYEKAVELIPDIVISDVMMPKKDGYQVTAGIKENTKTNHIPVIILSAKARLEDVKEGLIAGADTYLSKPFDKEELLLRLKNIRKQQVVLAQKYRDGFFVQSTSSNPRITKEEVFLNDLKSYIVGNLSDSELNVDSIQKHLDLSQKQLYRKIKAITGQSPTQLLRDLRLNEAEKLLKHKDLNVSEIAYQVGYSDPNYFSRVFQKEYGLTPTQYREKYN